MNCLTHGKSLVGHCAWCGTQLCNLEIAKVEGIKQFCSPCTLKLGALPKKKTEHSLDDFGHNYDPSPLPKRSTTFSVHTSNKHGYFDFSKLEER